MNSRFNYIIGSLILSLLLSCSSKIKLYEAKNYDFPTAIDTNTKPVKNQEKKKYSFDQIGVSVDNLFEGARLNSASIQNDTVIQIVIQPENTPINPSPWYAFRVQFSSTKRIYFQITYSPYKHRYNPKISDDKKIWKELNPKLIIYNGDSTAITFPIESSNKPVWIAAQEIVSTTMVENWCESLANNSDVKFLTIGKSALNRPLIMLDIGSGKNTRKPIIVILSRQHPPEVTGYFAMQQFISRILANDPLAQNFRKKYRLLVFPLINPDGVDEGHWRHNAGGIDLNRDWAYYRQPETRQIANRIVTESTNADGKVLIGLDFHSTWNDVYYTNKETDSLSLPSFKNQWLQYIQQHLNNYKLNESPSNVGQPVSKGWFYSQFKAVGITYEIGDYTDREFIKQKGIVSAEGLMRILLNEN